MEFLAKTFQGLESLLAEEIKSLGADQITTGRRTVFFTGDAEILYLCNYKLRTALRVLLKIKSSIIHNFKDLYDHVYETPWENFFARNKTFAITANSNSIFFKNSNYIAVKAKDAIVDRFRDRFGTRPNVNKTNPDIVIDIYIHERTLNLSIDSSGYSLHKRGYRIKQSEAPLNEVLAAGLLKLSGWSKNVPLYDPMCGSGSFLIEAIYSGNNIPPQLYRKSFSLKNWKDFNPSLWSRICVESNREILDDKCTVTGSDVSEKTLAICKTNIKKAGVARQIELKRVDFFMSPKHCEKLHLLINPPYDRRMNLDDAVGFYQNIGDTLKKNFTGSVAWIFSGNKEAIKRIGLKATKKYTLFNGPIESKFHKFEIY